MARPARGPEHDGDGGGTAGLPRGFREAQRAGVAQRRRLGRRSAPPRHGMLLLPGLPLDPGRGVEIYQPGLVAEGHTCGPRGHRPGAWRGTGTLSDPAVGSATNWCSRGPTTIPAARCRRAMTFSSDDWPTRWRAGCLGWKHIWDATPTTTATPSEPSIPPFWKTAAPFAWAQTGPWTGPSTWLSLRLRGRRRTASCIRETWSWWAPTAGSRWWRPTLGRATTSTVPMPSPRSCWRKTPRWITTGCYRRARGRSISGRCRCARRATAVIGRMP